MPRNVEVKIRVPDLDAIALRARDVGAEERGVFRQVDTYFKAEGRLKLREMDASAELIRYSRPDVSGLRTSNYTITPVTDPEAVKRSHEITVVVSNTRRLLMLGRTRIHLDRVEGLGDFLELEVILADGEDEARGREEAEAILRSLGIAEAERVAGSYSDLLIRAQRRFP